jgi:hypothetical protein
MRSASPDKSPPAGQAGLETAQSHGGSGPAADEAQRLELVLQRPQGTDDHSHSRNAFVERVHGAPGKIGHALVIVWVAVVALAC